MTIWSELSSIMGHWTLDKLVLVVGGKPREPQGDFANELLVALERGGWLSLK